MLILHRCTSNNSIKYEYIDMAKKKSRSANIARKREKRNRNRKSKQKQIAVAKQRNLHSGKMDEERLHTCIVQSLDLLEEPELEKVHFDVDLMHKALVRMFTDCEVTDRNEAKVSAEIQTVAEEQETDFQKFDVTEPISQEPDEIIGIFRTEILPQLITPKFMLTLCSALTACEKRLRREGDRDQADVALVTNSLFEAAPPHIIVEHPLVQHIGLKSMGILVNQLPSNEGDSSVGNIISEVLETENANNQGNEELSSMFSDAISEKAALTQGEPPHVSDASLLIPDNDLPLDETMSLPSTDTLPAKALYKNFNGLAIKDVLKEWQTDTLEIETDIQLDLFNQEQTLYITVTEDRVQLHTHSAEELTDAMESLEAHCESALMYLAKTIDEGGITDATE